MIRGPHTCFVIGLFAALLGQPALAQSTQLLKTMSGARGLVAQGKGGYTGTFPAGPFKPIAGELGRSVAIADLNGDGFGDLIVGAPLLPISTQSQVLDQAGHVYVIFGSAAKGAPGSTAQLELDPIVSGTALNLFGDAGDQAGASVAAAGDVNADGFDDVVIGTPNRTAGGRVSAGGAYIVFGAADLATLATDLWLSDLAAAPVNRALFVQGAREFGSAGSAVSGDVDVNDDGFSDVLVGAPLDSTNGHLQNGTATVLYGQPGFPGLHSFDLATLAVGEGTVVHGSADFQLLGSAVAGLGHFDEVAGDEVALGAPGSQSGVKLFAGAAYVLRGVGSGSHALDYSTADDFGPGPLDAGVVYLGAASGDQAGSALARIGPPEVGAPSGFTQLAISAPFNDGIGKADSGSAYLVYGSATAQGADLTTLSSAAGVTLWGAATAGGKRGVFVCDAGDFDGDGQRDVALGHPNAALVIGSNAYVGAGRLRILDGALLYASAAPVYLGNASVPWSLTEFSGESAGDAAGAALAAGDLNGDAQFDVAVGAPSAASDPKLGDLTGVARLETGRAHVVYGGNLRLAGPAQGPQTSGVFVAGATPYAGQPAISVAIDLQIAGGGALPSGDLVIEFGTPTLGYREGLDAQFAGKTVTVSLPPFLLGPQDVAVDVRARSLTSGVVGLLPGAFTYLASDFTEIPGFSLAGLSPPAPSMLMAGNFTNGGQVLLLLTGLKGSQAQGESLFLGATLAQPPTPIRGGLLGLEADFVVVFPGGQNQVFISESMPSDMLPAADGVPLYVQAIAQESDGTVTTFAFSNLLQMTINLP